jgi:hypothetical protein
LQDTTDGSTQGERRAGHYVSLRPKPAELAVRVPAAANLEIVNKIKAEMTIMELLSTNTAIITPSLCRLEALRVSAADLIESRVCALLYETIYPIHSADTEAGQTVRKLIKRYEDALRADGMVGEGLDITAVDDSYSNTGTSCGTIREIFTATSVNPIVEEENDMELEEDVAATPIASTTFLREARDKLARKDVAIREKESIVEKLRMMSVPMAGLVESPMIGKAVRQFYRKVAPPQSRAWSSAGKLYQDLRRQVLDNSAVLRDMEDQVNITAVSAVIRDMEEEGDITVIPEVEETDDTEYSWLEDPLQFGERLVAGTSLTIRLAGEAEDDVFDESAIPAVHCTTTHSASISSEAPMESTSINFSFQAEPQCEITDVNNKRKTTEK